MSHPGAIPATRVPGVPIVNRRTSCSLCDGPLETAFELPNLPLTGLFAPEPPLEVPPGVDQALLFCAGCGHGQLANELDPERVYDHTYSFRTSESATARQGTAFFLASLREFAPGQTFSCAIDVGCNDLHLLRQLESVASRRIGIDPVWAHSSPSDPAIQVIGAPVEATDLESRLPEPPDLILCRHTLEHVFAPRVVLERLLAIARPGALFVFEVPGFDALIKRHRFDQVFHQHLQYFSLSSFQHLLDTVGAEYLGYRENYHDWGAMLVVFRKGARQSIERVPPVQLTAIQNRLAAFKQQTLAARFTLEGLSGEPCYGFGAAQMLPILNYHVGGALEGLRAVLDDDPGKDGLAYQNLPLRIERPSEEFPFEHATIVITALDVVAPLLRKLTQRRPRHLVLPLNAL